MNEKSDLPVDGTPSKGGEFFIWAEGEEAEVSQYECPLCGTVFIGTTCTGCGARVDDPGISF